VRACLVLLVLLAAGAALPGVAAGAAPALRLGFSDLNALEHGDPADRPLELEHLKATGATSVRLIWEWRGVEKVRPPDDAAAADPAYAGYDFTGLDALLLAVQAAGLEPLLMINKAPPWWEGPDRPPVDANAPAGTWMPDAAAYGRFMAAAARRYDGSYPDPLHPGALLPRVRLWQIWNEPNLSVEITPQWSGTPDGRVVAQSPGIYKRLLSAAYDGVKSVAPDATVVTAGTAPFGDVPAPAAARMAPARFVRALLCVSGRAHPRPIACPDGPAKFDVLAHHPYPVGPPGRHAINPDDITIPDFAKLTRPLGVALRAGTVLPRTRSKPVWATEMSWDSNPPDPEGIPAVLQARYLAGALYVLWRQDVRALFWWNVRDEPEGRGFAYGLQSGVFLRGATVAEDAPKPAFAAFRFPFVAYRAYSDFRGHGRARLWGMAPAPGRVRIQHFGRGRWRTVATIRARADHVFGLRVAARRGTRLRAVQGSVVSIDAKVF
jgi:hypothetical protein